MKNNRMFKTEAKKFNSEPKQNIIQFREAHDHKDYTKTLI